MENNYQLLEDIFGWDVLSWSTCIKYWHKNMTIDLNTSRSLEIGTGKSGGLSLWLALKGSSVVSSDIGGVSEVSKVIHKKYSVSNLIKYQDIDALNIPYHETFDVIAFKSILGGISRNENILLQKQAINQMYHALKPGGEVLFAENLQATKAHMYFRDKFGSGKNSWRYFTIDEMLQLLLPFKNIKFITTGFFGCFGRNQKQRNFLAKVDQILFNHLVKEELRYIIIGIAAK